MPGRPWTLLHPETQLSAHDVETICDAARRAELLAAGSRRADARVGARYGGIDMETTTLDMKVQDFLAQKRIAVAGVSRHNSNHPVGNLIYHRLKKSGHEVFAVNPHMQTFEGDRCYPDLQSIPGGVDGVVIITRPDTTARIVRDCTDAGVHRVWMHQSLGKGSSVSPEAVEYCRQQKISVIAGACPMMYGSGADFGHTCMRWILRLTGGLPT
jgi:predicted CoA-binding protein